MNWECCFFVVGMLRLNILADPNKYDPRTLLMVILVFFVDDVDI